MSSPYKPQIDYATLDVLIIPLMNAKIYAVHASLHENEATSG